MVTVRFTSEGLDTFPLEVIFEGSFESTPRVQEYVVAKTKAVYQITGVIHVLDEDAMARIFATTRLVRPAPRD